MENPMNKWMISGVPQFFGNTHIDPFWLYSFFLVVSFPSSQDDPAKGPADRWVVKSCTSEATFGDGFYGGKNPIWLELFVPPVHSCEV